MHGLRMMHRDIKPENILVSLDQNKRIKDVCLSDFGLAKINLKHHMKKEACGTPIYMAPELFENSGTFTS